MYNRDINPLYRGNGFNIFAFMKIQTGRGFTLIELLVVIAILGILASIILATLNTAKDKGVDAKVKAELNSIHTQTELFANANNNSFVGMCTTVGGVGVANLVSVAAGITGATVDAVTGNAGAYNHVACHEGTSAWAVDAPLSNSTSGTPRMWCVDSIGKAKQESAGLGAGATTCA